MESLEAWDVSYYSEKLRQQRYQVSQEDIRPYLPVNRVLPGLFEVVQRLYGIEVRESAHFDSYHPDVSCLNCCRMVRSSPAFTWTSTPGRTSAAEPGWMTAGCARAAGRLQIPVAYLVCNFTPPVGDAPALLTHNELTTLFHEFGHGLHHMLTRQTVAAVSGINGVAWDAVELPSQFLENWCWERDALAFISGHHETGEPLPTALLDKLLAARNFQSAMIMARQLEFSLFDFRLHLEWASGTSIQYRPAGRGARQVAVVSPPAFNRFQNSFLAYFRRRLRRGLLQLQVGRSAICRCLLALRGGRHLQPGHGRGFQDAHSRGRRFTRAHGAVCRFRGREPSIDPLLRHSGIASLSHPPPVTAPARPAAGSVLATQPVVDQTRQSRTNNRRNPEQPQLGNRPTALNQRDACAASGLTEVLVTGMLIR